MARNQSLRIMSIAEATELPRHSWNFAKAHYVSTILLCLLFIAVYMLSKIPLVGYPIYALIQTYLGCGAMLLFKEWERGQQPSWQIIIRPIQDQQLFVRLLPLAIFSAAMTLATYFISQQVTETYGEASFMTAMIILLVTATITPFTAFVNPIVIFNSEASVVDAVLDSFSISLTNVIPLTVLSVILFVALALSILFLVLPVFFIFIPMVIPMGYFIYRLTYEDLVLKP